MQTLDGALRLRSGRIAALAIATAVFFSISMGAATRDVFTATAISTGDAWTAPSAGRLTLAIDQWTTPEQSDQLIQALKQGGQKAMLERLVGMHQAGSISSPGNIGYPIPYAVQDPLPDGGRHIVMMIDRPISFAEAWDQPRTIDYSITYIELTLDKNGHGEGKMLVAAKPIPAGKRIIVEDWSAIPVRLTDVKQSS